MWEGLVPELPVADVAATQRWYRDVLGFRIEWIWDEGYGAVCNGEARLFFVRHDGAHPTITCCAFTEAVDAVHAELVRRGAEIVSPLEDKPWGMREFTLRDPNGHQLRIGRGIQETTENPRFRTLPDEP